VCRDTAPFVAKEIQKAVLGITEGALRRLPVVGSLGSAGIVPCLYNTFRNKPDHNQQPHRVQPLPSLPSYGYFRTMGSQQNLPRVRRDIKFRVLIIGRANAGKTSILQRVCDTTENPQIYSVDESGARTLVCSQSVWLLPPSSTSSSHQVKQLDPSQEVKRAYIRR
jgi:hypothetical protein